MPLFGRSKPHAGSSPRWRTVSRLYPNFYTSIHTRLVANGGSDSEAAIAAGVANALYNTAENLLERLDDRRALTELRRKFENRDPQDGSAADRIIDWLVAYSHGTDEWIPTLLGRLDDVLSRPASE
jgi:hypothetical protein